MERSRIRELLASRRTRRESLGWGAAATGAAAVAALSGLAPALALDGTPEALGVIGADDKVMYLFVQAFHNGSWQPGAEAGTYTLTLNGGLASTIYFSDRPQRIYGASPTDLFLADLGFTPDDPPNAALVVNSDGVADILVIELFDPVYDDAAQTLTYTAKVLEAYHEAGLEYLAVQQEDDSIPQEFGAGALFIDDCADGWIQCTKDGRNIGEPTKVGMCYAYMGGGCDHPCRNYCPDLYPAECGDGGCGYHNPNRS